MEQVTGTKIERMEELARKIVEAETLEVELAYLPKALIVINSIRDGKQPQKLELSQGSLERFCKYLFSRRFGWSQHKISATWHNFFEKQKKRLNIYTSEAIHFFEKGLSSMGEEWVKALSYTTASETENPGLHFMPYFTYVLMIISVCFCLFVERTERIGSFFCIDSYISLTF